MTTYSTDPALYIFTSLTAGSSHIVTATSRLETILRANRVPFKAVDIATDEKARMLWGRRAGKDESGRVRKLPGLVQEGLVLGDLVEIEDWNEYGELKMHVKIYQDEFTIPSINDKIPEPLLKRPVTGSAPPAASASSSVAAKSTSTPAPAAPPAPPLPQAKTAAATTAKPKKEPEQKTLPVRSVADEAAQKAKELRLKSLREKVHGKDGAKAKEAEEKAAAKSEPVKSEPVKDKKADDEEDDEDSDEEESEEESEEEDDDDDDDDDDSEDEKDATKKPTSTPAAATKSAEAKPKVEEAKEKK